ncbi:hypothetical protein DYB26_003183 [Aphanomyces astaci]|uniref:RGS domain-containing protein n=3 Tax=Aphanomyces astaci TaxID=112090 RepID=A0A418CTY4_APHAT|nr:hypothetical protein DYB26_003183 [Aphanomyces astaci]
MQRNLYEIEPGPLGVYVVLVFVSCCLPVAIGVFVRRRKFPTIRYANPRQTAFCSSMAAVLSLGGSCMLLNQHAVACGTFNAFLFVFVVVTLFGLALNQLTLVLTFNLTQHLVNHHADTSDQNKAKSVVRIMRLRRLLQPRAIVVKWMVGTLLWLLPPVAILDHASVAHMQSLSVADCIEIPLNVAMNFVLLALVGVFIASFGVLAHYLSKVIDNFGLRRRYQTMGRLLAVLFVLEAIAIEYRETYWVATYKLRYVILPIAGFVVVGCQVVWPLVHSRHELPVHFTVAEGHGSKLAVLEDYLATPDGYLMFSAFARLEFSFENVVAWKAAFEFRLHGGGDAYAIYKAYMAVGAPMETNIPDALRQHYHRIFAKDRKGKVVLGLASAIDHDSAVFDLFRDAILKLMALDTLPRFQHHALGQHYDTFAQSQAQERLLSNVLKSLDQLGNPIAMDRSLTQHMPLDK